MNTLAAHPSRRPVHNRAHRRLCPPFSSLRRRLVGRTAAHAVTQIVLLGLIGGLVLGPPIAASDRYPIPAFIRAVEAAHGTAEWHAASALEADLTVSFHGDTLIQGAILTRTDTSSVRITHDDGTVAIFDGERAWVTPDADAFTEARFMLRALPYLLAVPAKLRDPGAYLVSAGTARLHDVDHPTAHLTFAKGVGDTSEDWYRLYRHPETDRLRAMAYATTYHDPSQPTRFMIVYDDYVIVDGVALATRWTFYDWSAEEGPVDAPIGEVVLVAPRFIEPSADAFQKPQDAIEAHRPRAVR
ncbi:MAG: hypothetical protein AAF772_15200 [Acidobacteriota bacterium]